MDSGKNNKKYTPTHPHTHTRTPTHTHMQYKTLTRTHTHMHTKHPHPQVGCQFIKVAIHRSSNSPNAHKGGNSLNLHRGGSFIKWMGQFLRGFDEWATFITSAKVAIHRIIHSSKKWNWPIHLMNEPQPPLCRPHLWLYIHWMHVASLPCGHYLTPQLLKGCDHSSKFIWHCHCVGWQLPDSWLTEGYWGCRDRAGD